MSSKFFVQNKLLILTLIGVVLGVVMGNVLSRKLLTPNQLIHLCFDLQDSHFVLLTSPKMPSC